MKKIVFMCLILCMGMLLLTGCATTPGGVAASTLPLTSKDSYVVLQNDVEGNSWCMAPLNIELWPASPYLAIQDAKAKNNCDGLINVQLNTTLVLFIYKCYHVSGDAIKVVKTNEIKR
ncbi:MAG: hypothetical protein WCI51_20755 [Lentisphaerota bacterium]